MPPFQDTQSKRSIAFGRQEWNGAFGDLGTDLPLLAGMILTAKLDAASVLILFGVMQILTGLFYRIPMPVQPLKAMATLVISQHLSGNLLFGGGIAIGLTMGILAVSGVLDLLAKWIALPVVRGLQLGLAIQLGLLALKDYAARDGLSGYALALVAFLLILLLQRRAYPAALFVLGLGMLYAIFVSPDSARLTLDALLPSLSLPKLYAPTLEDITQGFILLALPQLALSIGNSILATQRAVQDLFPSTALSVRRIGLSYAAMNLFAPLFSGVPVCHGVGGLAGHYAFGARTGGSVIIYGGFYVLFGLLFSGSFDALLHAFPMPLLGVMLFFEAVALSRVALTPVQSERDFGICALTALIVLGLPYGFLAGLLLGSLAYYALKP
jgi:MFS superfamily sulfate permease-like transporter